MLSGNQDHGHLPRSRGQACCPDRLEEHLNQIQDRQVTRGVGEGEWGVWVVGLQVPVVVVEEGGVGVHERVTGVVEGVDCGVGVFERVPVVVVVVEGGVGGLEPDSQGVEGVPVGVPVDHVHVWDEPSGSPR